MVSKGFPKTFARISLASTVEKPLRFLQVDLAVKPEQAEAEPEAGTSAVEFGAR